MSWLSLIFQAIGLVDVGLERYVSDTGDDTEDGSEDTPYRTINRALVDAAGLGAGQRLVVRISGTIPFVESLALPSHVWLEGAVDLQAATPGPAIRVIGTPAARVTDVQVRDLRIGGTGPYVGNGGAVLVQSADDITLERCELRNSVAGRGGGLAVVDSTAVTVRDCRVHDNTAGTAVSALTGLGLTAAGNVSLPAGDGHGGGIYVRDSDAEIQGCDITENHAILFGGGIAISHQARPAARVEVVDCQVSSNQVSHPPLAALAAPMTATRPDMGDPVREPLRDTRVPEDDELKLLALLHGLNFESGLGGGIGIRMATATRIAKCRIGVTRAGGEGANRARRGGGISCYSGAYPTIEENEIANNVAGGDGGGIGIDQFDPYLPPGTGADFGVTEVPLIPRLPIQVTRNHIHDNSALEDGGGLYGSGGAQVVVRGGVVENNRSAEDGGGLRVTFASNLLAEGVTIRDNQSNIVGVERDGGGGVAARNASVHLQDCDLTNNFALGFAGGGVYFVSSWEGGIEGAIVPSRRVNRQGTFDEIMAHPAGFNFRTRVLRIVNCRASQNRALSPFGAGGFLYAVRSPEPGPDGIFGGGESMWVALEGTRTVIGPNRSEHDRDGMRKRGNVVIELSGRNIGTGLIPQDRVWISPDIPAGAIAPSEPAMPPATARAVLVMRGADPAGDMGMAAWPGAPGFAFGPVPTVAAVDRATASARGGTTLRVTGTGFETGLSVLVGERPATFVSNTATEVVVTSPVAPAGPSALPVTVVSPSGAWARLPNAVTVLAPPTITAISPTHAAQNAEVTVTGTGLVPSTEVHLLSGGTEAAATVVGTPTGTQLRFRVPASPGPAPIDVRVTSPAGDTATRPGGFTYAP